MAKSTGKSKGKSKGGKRRAKMAVPGKKGDASGSGSTTIVLALVVAAVAVAAAVYTSVRVGLGSGGDGAGAGAGGSGEAWIDNAGELPRPSRNVTMSRIVRTPTSAEDDWGVWKTRDCDVLVDEWLYKVSVPFRGYHVVCFNPAEPGSVSDKMPTELVMKAYRDGQKSRQVTATVSGKSTKTLRADITAALKIAPIEPGREHRQPWAFFTNQARRASTKAQVEQVMLLFEGGQWLWPGIEIGHMWEIENLVDGAPNLVLETLELQPLVLSVHHFLALSECDYIVGKAKPHFFTSEVAHQDKDIGKDSSTWRTSEQHWLKSTTPALKFIDRRIEELVRVPEANFEATQVLQYIGTGSRYVMHHDYFDVNAYRQNAQLQRAYKYGAVNRLATVFEYCSTVRSGGHTVFGRAGGLPQPADFADCNHGLRVAPEKGRVIIFYSLHPNGATDEFSLHGGCPPLPNDDGSGPDIKHSANKWVWNAPTGF
ncbi:proly 4-hydroxylase [Thecamonas trahens ATCC 50062]|uniref:Proly 4-hydroxylase n=1 Tax=Thecamonas trahens ATCC 50062 TaxID=461836 RepID=A0A0L0D1I3_THETB|nr:proly 4-hydroxylase [Thecamonas trahens ATCC 50062]KNC46097.1 proly 4-hydroxylase [Thecamonas trahens ATCC 50062]|eukprot:XP_013763075.1 proly 4-hydroxylase [Thecamonas trahens ATCC 50062]